MLKRYLICCLVAAAIVWLIEAGSMAIAHSSGGVGLVILICPGMLPVFFGLFTNEGLFNSEYFAWAVAVALTAGYYMFIWEAIRGLKQRRAKQQETPK